MKRALLAIAALAIAGCTQAAPKLAEVHVSCGGQNIDSKSVPPDHGQTCAAGSTATVTYDNDGNYGFVAVLVNSREAITFVVPESKDGDSITAQQGHNIELGTFTVPNKIRDVVAMFSREPLHAKDIEQHLREVTLLQMPATEVRVRVSGEHGPVD